MNNKNSNFMLDEVINRLSSVIKSLSKTDMVELIDLSIQVFDTIELIEIYINAKETVRKETVHEETDYD